MKKRRLHLYTAAMLFACTYSLHGQTTYTDGVFMLNEDWYGHNNSTLNFIRPDHPTDPFEYYIIQNNESNAGQSLGATAQFGAVYGDYLFIISKQDQDAGDGLSPGESAETRQGGRIVVADAQTMEIKSRIPIIRANEKGVSIADGRSFVGVDETKGYVGTSNGIYIFSFSPFEITGRIEGTENPLITGDEDNADGVGPLYQNQIGMMLRTADYVFAIQQDKGVLVIDPQTDKIIHTVEGCFSTMAQSKDGDIWVGRNTNMDYQHYPYGNMGSSGECWEGKELLRIDPETFETEAVPMTEGSINQTWYAWTAGSLCASTQENVLYFTYNDNRWSWFTTSKLYRFDIDTRTFTQIYDSATDKRYFYGAGIRIHPLDDQIYGALYLDNVVQSYWIYQMDNQGNVLKELEPIDRYWFPALFIFPDNHAPEVEELPDVTLEDGAVEIDLGHKATDKDNLDAAIVKTVKSNSNEDVVGARIRNHRLTLQPKAVGEADLVIRFNSNGKYVDRTLHVKSLTTGILHTEESPVRVWGKNGRIHIKGLQRATRVLVYDTDGRQIRDTVLSPGDCIEGLPGGKCYILKFNRKQYKLIY